MWPHLKKAPIVEALIDIRVELPPDCDLARLARYHERVADQYPVRRERFQWRSEVRISKQEALAPEQKLTGGMDGYLFEKGDRSEVVQVRLDGFSFSRLQPYTSWGSLRTEAERLWAEYRVIADPVRITRVAVRYINRIALPLPIQSLSDWFVLRPELPGVLAGCGPGFLLRVQSDFGSDQPKAIVSLLIEPGANNGRLPFVLDIDVFQEVSWAPDSALLWSSLEKLRELKNELFFQSTSTRLLQALEPTWEDGQG